MGGIFGQGGGGSTTVVNTPAPMTQEEKDLIALQKQLGEKQLASYDQIQPYQQQLLDYSLQQLQQNQAYTNALNKAITPEDQAAAQAQAFKQAQELGPLQQQLLQMQVDQIKSGGAATPEQLARINEATDAGIAAGTNDINTQTKRGIGMIADELANSRGLRLSDSPMTQEAALLTRAGNDQIASLTGNLRAAGASAKLNYPLAVQQLTGAQNQSQQNLIQSAQSFQDQLRQQAYQNRLSLTGTASGGGIGLAGIGPGNGALQALNSSRGSTQTSEKGLGFGESMQGIGQLAGGVASVAALFM